MLRRVACHRGTWANMHTANLAGICGMSVPCGATTGGLPIGLQILGPAMQETNILRVGYAYEQAGGAACASCRTRCSCNTV